MPVGSRPLPLRFLCIGHAAAGEYGRNGAWKAPKRIEFARFVCWKCLACSGYEHILSAYRAPTYKFWTHCSFFSDATIGFGLAYWRKKRRKKKYWKTTTPTTSSSTTTNRTMEQLVCVWCGAVVLGCCGAAVCISRGQRNHFDRLSDYVSLCLGFGRCHFHCILIYLTASVCMFCVYST